jgi:hypothetical protein
LLEVAGVGHASRTPPLFSLVVVALGCSGDPGSIPQAGNVARVAQVVGSATAFYMGRGLAVTNWHVCVDYVWIEVLGSRWAESDWPRVFNAPADGSPPYSEGTSFTDHVCYRADGAGGLTVSTSHQPSRECPPVSSADLDAFDFSAADVSIRRFDPKRVVYANIDLDLCIIEMAPDPAQRLESALPRLTIDPTPPKRGQTVVVAGHPAGVSQLVVQECQVTSDGTTPVKDPDTINPSNLVVPSFSFDCSSVAPGSSGSPVFDASTGHVLGVLWTGDSLPGARTYEHGYASSASEWVRYLEGPARREHHSRLAALLDEFMPASR